MTHTSALLAAAGWTVDTDSDFHPYREQHRPARVSRIERGGADLITDTGPMRATYGGALLAAAAQDRTTLPTVGDWAAIRDWPDGRLTIEALLPRRTALIRHGADRTSHGQVLAANVDLVVVVEHLDPEPSLARIERLLVLARGSGAAPLVVLTKTDLVPDAHGMAAEVEAVAPGVDVIAASVPAGSGVDTLRGRIGPGTTAVLLGPSGAGKSTLVNALAGAAMMDTAPTRARDGKGRHTTTRRELIILPGGGVVLDTPGIRAVGMMGDPAAVADVFPEVDELARACRFRDCRHDSEPGCAVRAALADGTLDENRYRRWQKLGREAAFEARRADARLKAHQVAIWKQRAAHRRLHSKGGRQG
jgi:ribosome biogenesis GTPase